MSIFTGIKALFSAPKTIDKAVDVGDKITTGIIAGLDKIWHTEEEKSDAQQKANETLLGFWKTVANENTEQSKARRELANMVFKVYFSLFIEVAPALKEEDIRLVTKSVASSLFITTPVFPQA